MKRIFTNEFTCNLYRIICPETCRVGIMARCAPNSNGITTPEQKLENNRISNVSEPTLTIYPAAKPNGLAVVACPGGDTYAWQ